MDIMLWSGYGILIFYTFFFIQQPFISYLHTKEKFQKLLKTRKKVAKLQFTQ